MGVSQKPVPVSVIVPTRDRPALLREALASIRAAARPALMFEILVCDNGADPESRAAAEEFGARYLKVGKNGAGAARNAGLAAATGDFVAFLDDDDVWLPGNITPQVGMMMQDPSLDAVFGEGGGTGPGERGEPPAAAASRGGASMGAEGGQPSGFSFDEFFNNAPGAGQGSRAAGRPSRPPTDDPSEMDQFQAWLKKLKS